LRKIAPLFDEKVLFFELAWWICSRFDLSPTAS
jgi:hypothetical protein